jgi:hypothetical protein
MEGLTILFQFAIFIFALVGFVLYHRCVGPALENLYAGLRVRTVPMRGDVRLHYFTYHGLMVYAIRTEHDVWLSADEARILLDRLLFFNLSWGILCLLSFLLQPISLVSYWWQRQSISLQKEAGGAQPVKAEVVEEKIEHFPPPEDPSNPYNPPYTANPDIVDAPPVSLGARVAGGFLIFVSAICSLALALKLVEGLAGRAPIVWEDLGLIAGVTAFILGLGSYVFVRGM